MNRGTPVAARGQFMGMHSLWVSGVEFRSSDLVAGTFPANIFWGCHSIDRFVWSYRLSFFFSWFHYK